MKPYGGFIGIDNSSVDKYFKISKVLRLHAILNDAGGFIYELYSRGPGYSFMLPRKSINSFSGYLSGKLFLFIYKGFSSVNFSFFGMLSSKTVVLDVERFRNRKKNL